MIRFRRSTLFGMLVTLAGLPLRAQDSPGNPLDGLARLKAAEARRSSSADPDWRNGNADSRPIAPGATLVIADLKGPGVITHIWNTVSGERGYSRLLRLRMYWDGEAEPSVDCPLGDFFAVGHGMDAPMTSIPVAVSSKGRARNCYWPMPFRKSAKVTLTNEGRSGLGVYWYVDWHAVKALQKDSAYFHAQYRQEFPAKLARNYVVADLSGRGHYVGTVLSVRSHSGGWWGEGDDLWFIDGEREPSLRGTGSEDYFCDAWGVYPQTAPYYGTTVWEGNEAVEGHTTVYRWHIPDPISFHKSLRMEMEHKGVTWQDGKIASYFGARADDFSSVAFWYQVEPHLPFPPMPVGYERLYEDPADIVEGESLIPGASATAGAVERQELGGRSGGAQLFWKPDTAGKTLTLPFAVSKAGTYDLRLLLTRSWDYGIAAISLDGEPLGEPIDLYDAQTVDLDRPSDRHALAAGPHMLGIEITGKNEKSKGFYFGLDGISLARQRP